MFWFFEECGGSVVECLTQDKGLRVRALTEALGCVFEQGLLICLNI